MARWLALFVIGALVLSCISGCAFVVPGEEAARDVAVAPGVQDVENRW